MNLECLPTRLGRMEALELCKKRRSLRPAGQVISITEFYVPYYLFQIEICNAGQSTKPLLAIDAINGELDLYSFDEEPQDLQIIQAQQALVPKLSEPAALAMLKEKVQRNVFLKGFFQIRNLSIEGHLLKQLHIPYWLALLQQGQRTKIEVIDAVRKTFEGAKTHEIANEWLRR